MSKHTAGATIQLHSLSEHTISYEEMKQWKWSGREPYKVLQRFIELNRRSFSFLGIEAHVECRDYRPVVVLRTSEYVGAAPVFSPITGKPDRDIVVNGRFGEPTDEIVATIQEDAGVEFSDHLRLTNSSKIFPPQYIECIRYIQTYIDAYRYHWQKFENRVCYNLIPLGMTDWQEYALRSASDPAVRTCFKNRRNLLTTNHTEWQELTYVCRMCIEILTAVTAPARIRYGYQSLLSNTRRLIEKLPIKEVKRIRQKMSDPIIISTLKGRANNVLQNRSNIKMAWRIDFNKAFECYVQNIFEEVTKKCNAKLQRNPQYRISGPKLPQWGLRYLEPDMILLRENDHIVVDAKYKSHLYNISNLNDTPTLKIAFRQDLHQIMAYTTMSEKCNRTAILAYPSNGPYYRTLSIKSPYSGVEIKIYLVGIILDPTRRPENVNYLLALVREHFHRSGTSRIK